MRKEKGELERYDLGRSDRLQKRKVVKREKWKGMCVDEKKQREKKKKKKCGTCVEDKKKGKKNGITIFSQQILSGRLLLANICEKKIILILHSN